MYTKNGTLEITTKIGCDISCKFCPQRVLIQKYFAVNEQDKKPPVYMSFETFKNCIDKIPQDIMIDFAGMCEPWLNRECTEMVKYASQKGHEIRIYSTLVGMDEADVEVLSGLRIKSFVLHAADAEGNSHIVINECYKKTLKKLMELQVGELKAISVHGAIHPDIEDIITQDWEQDNVELIDRAGNLECEEVRHCNVQGSISCDTCGWELNHNILLPDGSVLLCCNDYGMRHVLGNLLYMNYEELFNSEEYKRIKNSMFYGKGNILCNTCSNANNLEGLTEKYIRTVREKDAIYRDSQLAIRNLRKQVSLFEESKEFYKTQAENYQREFERTRCEKTQLEEARDFYKSQANNYQREYQKLYEADEMLQKEIHAREADILDKEKELRQKFFEVSAQEELNEQLTQAEMEAKKWKYKYNQLINNKKIAQIAKRKKLEI